MNEKLGCLPRELPVGHKHGFPVADDDHDFRIDRADWWEMCDNIAAGTWVDDLVVRSKIRRRFQQFNSCSAETTGNAGEALQIIQGGDVCLLSSLATYNRVRGGRDQGASIDAVCRDVTRFGMMPLKDGDNGGYDDAAWGLSPPRSWQWDSDLASKHRIREFFDAPTFDSFFSGLLRGYLGAIGVWWSGGGPVFRGGGGHSILACRPVRHGGEYGFEFQNSHGLSYGNKGFGYCSESAATAGINTFGAWLVRVGA